MTHTPQIVVAGSHAPGLFIRVKRVPQPGETVIGWDFHEPMDGGKGSNQAIAAARLGSRVSFIGCVGRDRIGDEGEQWMRQEGVDTRFLLRSEHLASGVGFILLDEQGVPAMVTSMGANAELSESDVEQAFEQLSGAQVYLTQFEIRPEVALHGAAVARRLGISTLMNPAPAVPMAEGAFCIADILTPNENEARLLLGVDQQAEIEPDELALALYRSSGAGCVLVTLGEQGIAGADAQGVWRVSPPQVKVVDTSGAGDVFCAALAVGLTNGTPVRVASDWACQVAALSVTRPGTIPSFPTMDEVRAFTGEVKRYGEKPALGLSQCG